MQPSELSVDAQALLRRHGLLQELVLRCVRSEAVETVVLSDEELTAAHQALATQLCLDSEEALAGHFQAQGLDLDEAIWQLTLPQRVRHYSQKHFGPKAEARFLDRKADLDAVVYSLLRVKDRGLANELFLRITGAEASFSDLASQFSEGHEKATRGIIGPVPMVKAHPQLRDLLRTATPGEVQPPILIEGWFLVVRLESRIPAVLDDSTRLQMEQELFEADVQHKASAVLATLLKPSSTLSPDA
jgi:parvulin-like peptidyl-prolyl isomerase